MQNGQRPNLSYMMEKLDYKYSLLKHDCNQLMNDPALPHTPVLMEISAAIRGIEESSRMVQRSTKFLKDSHHRSK